MKAELADLQLLNLQLRPRLKSSSVTSIGAMSDSKEDAHIANW